MRQVAGGPVVGADDHVTLKPICSAAKTCLGLEKFDVTCEDSILSRQRNGYNRIFRALRIIHYLKVQCRSIHTIIATKSW